MEDIVMISSTIEETLEEEDSLLTLNDDCLELIFLYLNRIEQFAMWKLHLRFQAIIDRLWFYRLHTVYVEDQHLDILNDIEFLQFMNIISANTINLTLIYLKRYRFELLIDLCFERVTVLKCIDPFVQHRNQDERYGRKAVQVLQCCFPKVQELELIGYHLKHCHAIYAIGPLKRLKLKIL